LDRRRESGQVLDGRAAGEDRAEGTAHASSRRALRRPAAARRDRACARLAARDRLRRRADGEPRLEDERRDPRTDARLGRLARPDDRDGDARAARSRDRGSRVVPRGRADRARAQGPHGSGRRFADADARQLMLRVALKGLAGRKLRALLTGLAIVLGVAMVSGTYVLTDTLKA